MVLHIGPHDLTRAGMIDGAFQLGNLSIWTDLIAHQEQVGFLRGFLRLATAERRLTPFLGELPLQGLAERFGRAAAGLRRRAPALRPQPRHR